MRFLVPVWMLCAALLASAAHADPAAPAHRLGAGAEPARTRLGAALHWTSTSFGQRLGLGLGWTVPQRWYDVDGQLLTERSLLHPGEDLERSGVYLALRF